MFRFEKSKQLHFNGESTKCLTAHRVHVVTASVLAVALAVLAGVLAILAVLAHRHIITAGHFIPIPAIFF
jgi:hypothetical protein